MTPQEYLELLQSQAAEQWGLSEPDFPGWLQGQRKEMLSRLPEPYREAAGRLFSSSPSVLEQGKRLADMIRAEIQQLLPEDDWRRVSAVPVGIIPSAEFNGFAMRCPDGGDVAVLNAGLIGSLHGVNKTYISFTVAEEDDDSPRDLDEAERLVQRFPDFARSIVSMNRFTQPKPLQVGRGQLAIANIYTNIQELFFFAHEYQHILLGHLNDCVSTAAPLPGCGAVDVYLQSQEEELAADTAALKTIRHAGHGDPNIQAAALCLVFNLLSLCERMDGEGDSRPTTHPSAEERKRNVLSYFDKEIHQGGRELIQKMDLLFEICGSD